MTDAFSITVSSVDLKKILIDLESTNVRSVEGEVLYLHGAKDHIGSRDELTGDILHKFESIALRNGFQLQSCLVKVRSEDGKVYTGTVESLD